MMKQATGTAFVVLMLWAAANPAAADVFTVDRLSATAHQADLRVPSPLIHVKYRNFGRAAQADVDAVSQGLDAVMKKDIVFFSLGRQNSQPQSVVYVTVIGNNVMSPPMGRNVLDTPATRFGLKVDEDNLDGCSMEELDYNMPLDLMHDVPAYFSLEKSSLPSVGHRADLLRALPGQGVQT